MNEKLLKLASTNEGIKKIDFNQIEETGAKISTLKILIGYVSEELAEQQSKKFHDMTMVLCHIHDELKNQEDIIYNWLDKYKCR